MSNFTIAITIFLATVLMAIAILAIFSSVQPDPCNEYTSSKPTHCYITGNMTGFDLEHEKCHDGYVRVWTTWTMECMTPENAIKECYNRYPQEFMIDSEHNYLMQRTIYVWDVDYQICATKVSENIPTDMQQFIKDFKLTSKYKDNTNQGK